MSNHGRALISALNAGDYQSVDQYTDLSDLDLKIVNHHVHELFERAIRTENFKLFRALLKIPKVQVSSSEYCALRHAAKQGLVDFVSDVARVPTVNANLVDKEGFTALHYALKGSWSQKKALEIVRAILLTTNVKANLRARDNRTVLHMAMEKQWFDVAATLVDAGAHPKMEDAEGNTPLGMALANFGDLPGDLFGRMISFNDDVPEEEVADFVEAVKAPEEDHSHKTPGLHVQHQQDTPQVRSHGQQHSQVDPPQQQEPEPIIRQVVTVVEDKYNGTKAPDAVKAPPPTADNADLETVMGGQELDDTLVKQFLFLPNGDDPRIRLHRKAVLEGFAEVLGALKRSGQSLDAEDARRVDNSSGHNLWHAAALHGTFSALIEAMVQQNSMPTPEDLMLLGSDGQSPAMILDGNAKLQAVLSHEFWFKYPQLLTAMLAGLPDKRRRSFSTLISKAHLLLLAQTN